MGSFLDSLGMSYRFPAGSVRGGRKGAPFLKILGLSYSFTKWFPSTSNCSQVVIPHGKYDSFFHANAVIENAPLVFFLTSPSSDDRTICC